MPLAEGTHVGACAAQRLDVHVRDKVPRAERAERAVKTWRNFTGRVLADQEQSLPEIAINYPC